MSDNQQAVLRERIAERFLADLHAMDKETRMHFVDALNALTGEEAMALARKAVEPAQSADGARRWPDDQEIPAGWKLVAYRHAKVGEHYLAKNGNSFVFVAHADHHDDNLMVLIVEPVEPVAAQPRRWVVEEADGFSHEGLLHGGRHWRHPQNVYIRVVRELQRGELEG